MPTGLEEFAASVASVFAEGVALGTVSPETEQVNAQHAGEEIPNFTPAETLEGDDPRADTCFTPADDASAEMPSAQTGDKPSTKVTKYDVSLFEPIVLYNPNLGPESPRQTGASEPPPPAASPEPDPEPVATAPQTKPDTPAAVASEPPATPSGAAAAPTTSASPSGSAGSEGSQGKAGEADDDSKHKKNMLAQAGALYEGYRNFDVLNAAKEALGVAPPKEAVELPGDDAIREAEEGSDDDSLGETAGNMALDLAGVRQPGLDIAKLMHYMTLDKSMMTHEQQTEVERRIVETSINLAPTLINLFVRSGGKTKDKTPSTPPRSTPHAPPTKAAPMPKPAPAPMPPKPPSPPPAPTALKAPAGSPPAASRTTHGPAAPAKPTKQSPTIPGRSNERADWQFDVTAGSLNSSGVNSFKISIKDIQDKKPGDKKKSKAFRAFLHATGLISKGMDAGHAVGRQLAEGEANYNVFDERSAFNRRDKRTAEGRMRRAIDQNKGSRMTLQIETYFKNQPGNPEVERTVLRLVDQNTGQIMQSHIIQ